MALMVQEIAEQDKQQVIAALRKAIGKGSIRGLARSWGVAPQYITDVLNGNRAAGPQLLSKIGLRKVVSYERVKK